MPPAAVPDLLPQAEAIERLRQRYAALEVQLSERTWALEEALRAAEEAARAKSNLLAVMSHELRNPLHAILGIAQILGRSTLDGTQSRHVQTLRECGDALLHLINDILDFSKLESGRLQLESTPFEPADLHRQLEAMFDGLRLERGVTLRFAIDERVPAVLKGDPARLRQVLINLIGNALKFTSKGGVIVRCEAVGQAARNDVAQIEWSVTDTGIGIAPDHIEHLFQPYAQAHNAIHRAYGGTGLGLAICARLVEAMDGKIVVRSVPEKGSRFSFTVPLALMEEQAPNFSNTAILSQLSNAQGVPGLRPLRVLIVDDDRLNLMVTHTFASEFGAIAEEAVDGFEAVEKLQNHGGTPFDLVLLDMNMPDLDGPGTARMIRELSLDHQPRIIAVTANAGAADAQRCREAGMDDVLVKPYQREQLFHILGTALDILHGLA